MLVGIFAKTFPRPSAEESLDAAAAAGVDAIQFNLALAGGPSLPAEVPAELAARAAEATRARGLEMAAVSGTYNMAHPDPAVRADGQRRLATLIRSARALGTGVVTVCTGTRDPGDMWRRHPANGTPDAWADMAASMAAAVEVAEAHDVTLGVEPEHGNVVDSARAARRLLDDLRTPHVKIVLDAANLIVPGELVLAHAKDVEADGTVVAAGRGGLDYGRYVELLDGAGFDGALVLHGLDEAEVPESVAFVRSAVAATSAR
jgi:sugar phosphate isomerase/epimerase